MVNETVKMKRLNFLVGGGDYKGWLKEGFENNFKNHYYYSIYEFFPINSLFKMFNYNT